MVLRCAASAAAAIKTGLSLKAEAMAEVAMIGVLRDLKRGSLATEPLLVLAMQGKAAPEHRVQAQQQQPTVRKASSAQQGLVIPSSVSVSSGITQLPSLVPVLLGDSSSSESTKLQAGTGIGPGPLLPPSTNSSSSSSS